jgi:isoquinoline 1-oxidoreductase alpha subunit
MQFILNREAFSFDGDPQTPLLWVIRESAQLTGTKFGCGIGMCGACTVHVAGQPVRSCSVTVESVANRQVTTIEGLSRDRSHPVQQAWIKHDVPQCGYCQSGMIMAAAALLKKYPQPSDAQIDEHMSNLCRCATYHRIREAIHAAVRT